MTKKLYYLKTCDTCKKIIKEINTDSFIKHEIKANPITEEELNSLHNHTQSYELLLNKRAQKLKLIDTNNFSENDYKKLILQDYTFLKRPIFIDEEEAFIGNSKTTINALYKKYK